MGGKNLQWVVFTLTLTRLGICSFAEHLLAHNRYKVIFCYIFACAGDIQYMIRGHDSVCFFYFLFSMSLLLYSCSEALIFDAGAVLLRRHTTLILSTLHQSFWTLYH